ncbi:ribosomal protein S18-alanine N-acetyltransferase [Ornithinibacillus bavariensis]|uniref:[Ribosomal protein bS18]-alanine N-acetyltransferase n=1 Tax=Ornithinibacillus bavariensis TaxID=545502 RepID=A0A919XAM5_9BACI|nr:ribosomal protein S18-alanine N-acetyltransferase [Ornithinibacillus bavariensis]GIO28124.1 putative ribosomal-protein-alanine acetyltransferase [Ornithinibacillus bavariensis]HAM80886.1 ribosomal-protein-alanine N-acetyltransferase [Ornithinibacillus sp.]
MADVLIREMELADIRGVMTVEAASFTTPWTEAIFRQEITENKYAHYYVMELADKIVGYVGMWIVHDDAQITNIAILPDFRGKKLGETLFRFSLQKAVRLGVTRLSLEVRVTNIIAQRMYRKFGLVPGGLRKQYYTDNNEDALVMWVNLT